MLEEYGIRIVIGLLVIGFLLIGKVWGDGIYALTKNIKLTSFVLTLALLGVTVVIKQESFKHELAYYYYTGNYYTGNKSANQKDTQYKIRQCKEFVQAKLNGETVTDSRPVKAGFINISTISNWDFCAKTFGTTYWKYNTSINGENGGHVLCKAYARDTYRSGKVQTWCDTVFAPKEERDLNQET